MSLPPGIMQAAPATTATRPRFTASDWMAAGVLTLIVSAVYLLIDIALDPALLSHAARAGNFAAVLVFLGIGYCLGLGMVYELRAKRSHVEHALNLLSCLLVCSALPIMAIVWLDPTLPNIRYASLFFTSFGIGAIGSAPFGLSLLYGVFSARGRYTSEAARAERGVPGSEDVVGVGSLAWIATGVWFLAVVSTSSYGIWLALTNPFDNATLLMSFVIVCTALLLSSGGLLWIWWYARRYARQTGDTELIASTTVSPATQAAPQTGDAALLASATVSPATLAVPQRVAMPPDERPRWGISLLVGLGLFAFSLLTLAVLDFRFVQSSYADGSQQWLIAIGPSFFTWMGIYRASARRYQPERFRRLIVAAAAFVVVGDATWIDRFHLRDAIVPRLGLLAIAVLCAIIGFLICLSLFLHPVWEGDREPTGATVAGGQIRPRTALSLVLTPLLVAVVYQLYWRVSRHTYSWDNLVFLGVLGWITAVLSMVVNTDMPRQGRRWWILRPWWWW